jgi:glycerate dehydrogenase
MKIVVLDGYVLNPGDLNWDGFQKLGNLNVYERTQMINIVERSKDAEVLLTNKTPLNENIFKELPLLKYIGVLATGYNNVDAEAAKRHGIIITNIPAYSTFSVAQMTFALLLELCQHVQRHSDSVKEGKWAASLDFCFWDYPLIELAGKALGIIGFGSLGEKVADVATVLGMNILGADKIHTDQSHRLNFHWTEIPELLAKSDVVSIHCPLLPETKGLINKDGLKIMKNSAFLLNTSRGAIIEDEALANALNNGVIAGAGIDVLSVEPPLSVNPLLKAKNCIITPHIAWATKEARTRLMNIAVTNLEAFISGKHLNVINN